MRKILTFFGVLVILVIILVSFLKKDFTSPSIQTQVETKEEKKKPSLVDQSQIEEKFYNILTEYTMFDVSYPQFKNAPAEFNKKIEDLATEGIEGYTKDSEANWKARYKTRAKGEDIKEFPIDEEKFSFAISYIPIQVNANYISVLVDLVGYTGGAHGYKNSISFNYDITNKKEMKLADLFPDDSNYLKTISELARADLKEQIYNRLGAETEKEKTELAGGIMDMLLLGTEPNQENFNIFTFTPEEVTFYFTEYQVASYAMGEFKVSMPRK